MGKNQLGVEHSSFPFKTGFQYVPESGKQLPQLERLFRLLHRESFYGGKLNLLGLDLTKPEGLESSLGEYQIRMGILTTGVYTKTHGLSLSSGIPSERIRAINGCKKSIDYVAPTGCGIIIGLLKGGPGSDSEFAERPFLESTLKLKPYNRRKKNAGSH